MAEDTGSLPVGWEALKEPSSGKIYYHNLATGATQWEAPSAPAKEAEGPSTSDAFPEHKGEWQTEVDKSSGRMYYFHTKTMETTWERPVDYKGPEPHFVTQKLHTAVGDADDKKKGRVLSEWVDFSDLLEEDDGNLETSPLNERITRAVTRCDLRTDTMDTEGSNLGSPWVCVHFARGDCENGKTCAYLHRAPTRKDSDSCDPKRDIFGRRRRINRDGDLCGVNNTLCIPNIPSNLKQGGWGKISSVLKSEIGRYAPIKAIRPKPDHKIVFIEFQYRCGAEFAKEAMRGQTIHLPGIPSFVIHLRWATDPRHLRPLLELERREKAAKGIRDTVLPEWAAQYPEWQSRTALSQMRSKTKYSDPTAYPDTNEQYANTNEQCASNHHTLNVTEKHKQHIQLLEDHKGEDYALPPNNFREAIKRFSTDFEKDVQSNTKRRKVNSNALSLLGGYGSDDSDSA
uniref:Uncharacterized protein n=1 Tax=Amorphochlora amoebiformis TaxID=1561963 RepID=A0A7S0DRQ5_9EUKA|mmetsp:Transcript_3959/g.6066  ORF Transcript_3959/g.6066 Transcript_3959/m.6066 type:complete len:457 (+) Transcript_3959:20-1390(+)